MNYDLNKFSDGPWNQSTAHTEFRSKKSGAGTRPRTGPARSVRDYRTTVIRSAVGTGYGAVAEELAVR
jgi:hypothetical protein